MNTAIYLRKSRGDPEDESIDETLARHKSTLLQFAKTNQLTILEVYEEVVSGDGLFIRPQMIRLLSDIEADKFDGVLCMDIDRLGRVDTKDRGIILDAFKSHNTKIITPRKIYDLNDEIDEFSTEMQMLMARQELKKITQRMQTGIKKSIEEGYHVCEPPYGYRRIYAGKRPTLEICEEEARVVRMVFDMYVNQSFGSQVIAETINSMGYKTRKGSQFSRNTIRFFLQNPTYIGKVVWNKRKHLKKKFPTDKHRFVLNPEKQWIVSNGIHQPIIDEEIFLQAQQIRETRSHPPSFTGKIKNPFAGLIYCRNCGQIMLRQTSKKTPPRLLCPTVGCTKSTIISDVETAIINIVRDTVKTYQIQLNRERQNKTNNTINEIQSNIADTRKQLSILQKQNESLHDLLEQGVYDIATFTSRGKSLSERIAKTQAQIEEYQKRINSVNNAPRLQDMLVTMQNLLEHYDTLSPAEKNNMYKKFIDKIYYRRNKSNGSKFSIDIQFKQWV